MRHYSKKEVTEVQWVKEKVICDICKEEIHPRHGFDSSEIKIEARIGKRYPEGDFRNYYRLDCCRDCFEKVKHTLEKELGAEFTEGISEDYDSSGDEINE